MRTLEELEKHNRRINELAMKEVKPDHVIVSAATLAKLQSRSEYLEDYWKNLNNGSEM
jgi:hypothetical protein